MKKIGVGLPPRKVLVVYASALRSTARNNRTITTTATSGTSVWKSVMVPELTEVSAVVAIAVKAPGSTKAATYNAIDRNMTSTTIVSPSDIAPADLIGKLLKAIPEAVE